VHTLVARTGQNASATIPREAAARADTIILAVPGEALDDISASLGTLDGKIVVHVSGGLKRVAPDGYLGLVSESTNSERIQSAYPEARVVRLWIPSITHFVDPLLVGTPPDVLIAGNERGRALRIRSTRRTR
jgi:predicted dinucleotide-binding enzyme